MNETKHFYSLDLFRGFCGYGVAITHLQAFIFKSMQMEYLSLLFVEFFFVLSGFVLYPQLLRILNSKSNKFDSIAKKRVIETNNPKACVPKKSEATNTKNPNK